MQSSGVATRRQDPRRKHSPFRTSARVGGKGLAKMSPTAILWMDELLHHEKPWETLVYWYLQGIHHSRVS